MIASPGFIHFLFVNCRTNCVSFEMFASTVSLVSIALNVKYTITWMLAHYSQFKKRKKHNFISINIKISKNTREHFVLCLCFTKWASINLNSPKKTQTHFHTIDIYSKKKGQKMVSPKVFTSIYIRKKNCTYRIFTWWVVCTILWQNEKRMKSDTKQLVKRIK